MTTLMKFRLVFILWCCCCWTMVVSSSASMDDHRKPVVCVTGASGFIGSHVCKNLVEHGYAVRACVRSNKDPQRTLHLLALNDDSNTGTLELFEADMMVPGSYDRVFAGCEAVFHVAGNFGTDRRWMDNTATAGRMLPVEEALGAAETGHSKSYDHGVYDSYVVSMKYILDSVARSETVKRLIFTSSGCSGSVITARENEDDYSVEDNAYGKGKVDCERLIYQFGQEHGIVCCTSCPTHVLGPILQAPLHDMTYQHRLGEIFAGKYCLDMDWEVCDVRDIAETQRLMFESNRVRNGSRFFNGAPDSEFLSAAQMVSMMRDTFPEHANQIAGVPVAEDEDKDDDDDDDGNGSGSESSGSNSSCASNPDLLTWATDSRTQWADPEQGLGLHRHAVSDTVRDTIVAMQDFEMVNRQDVTVKELENFYQVAEMDGCDEEMEYILSELCRLKAS